MGALIAGGGTAVLVASALFFVWLLYLVHGPLLWLGLLLWPCTPITYVVLSRAAISRAPSGQRWARLLGVTIVPLVVVGMFVVQPYFESRSQTQNQEQAASVLDEFTRDLDLGSGWSLLTEKVGRCSVGSASASRRQPGNAADNFAWTQDVLAHVEGAAKWDVETAHLRKTTFVGYGDTETSIIYATRDGASALFATVYRDPGRRQEAVDTDARVRVWAGGCAGEQSIEDAIRAYYGYRGESWGADWDHWSDALPRQVPDPIAGR